MKKLHPYQEEAKQFVLDHPEVLLFLDCGLGKSIISLMAIRELLHDAAVKGVLVVAPLRVARMTWPLEIQDWPETRWMTHEILHGDNKEIGFYKRAHIYLINYEGLTWLAKKLKRTKVENWPFEMVVWDESTKMKSYGSQRFTKWRSLIKKFARKIALTGTPSPNSLEDLWGQVFVVDEGKRLGTAFTRFQARFFEKADFQGYRYQVRSKECEKKIYSMIQDICLRLSSDDHLDLPPCTEEIIDIKLPKKCRAQYEEFEAEMFLRLDNREEIEVFNTATLMGKCLQMAGGAVYYDEEKNWTEFHDEKVKAIKAIRKRHPKEPLLIAYAFRHEAARIKKAFPKAVFLKSGLSGAQEVKIQKDWNAGKISELVCHPASAGHGLNFQKGGCIAIHFTPNWSLELDHQFNCRINRQGQKRPTTIYRIIAEKTTDEVVLTTLERKSCGQKALLDALKQYRLTLK